MRVALLVVLSIDAHAQTASSPSDGPPSTVDETSSRKPSDAKLERIEVTGRRNETEERRLSTAAKIVIGRDEIEAYGDMSLADVMKRLPSVTIGGRPGRGGQIRMRGMGNGYTQILIDGERIPRGFAIDQLTPDLVERIEIYRAPTAETGARAIAGTINIVLREPLRQRSDDVRVGATEERGRIQPNLAWTRNDVLGASGTYNLTVSGTRAIPRTDTATDTTDVDTTTGATDLVQHLRQIQHDERTALHVSGRVQWNLGPGDQLSLQPFLSVTEGRTQVAGTLDQPFGFMPSPYEHVGRHQPLVARAARRAAEEAHRRVNPRRAAWRHRLVQVARRHGHARVRRRRCADRRPARHHGDQRSLVDGQRQALPYDRRAAPLHGRPRRRRRDARRERVDVRRWRAVAAGLRRRHRCVDPATRGPCAGRLEPVERVGRERGPALGDDPHRSESIGAPVHNRSAVLSPLAHAVWRFDEPARDRLRLSLTRSDRAPTLQNLIAVPSLSTLSPVPGPNTASSPDRAGSPSLRPELATGIDLALEHYQGAAGVVSISAFRRDIHDLIRSITTLETVPWAAAQRHVVRPRNFGDATTHGIEFDAKFQLDEVLPGAPALAVRTNASVYGSHVSGVPGPYNRIDQQPRASANLGADYRIHGLPLTVGGNFNWIPPYSVQETDVQSQSYQLTRVVDAYALWTVDSRMKLRLSLSNVVPREYVTTNTIVAGGQAQTVVANGPTYRVVGLRFELKL